MSLVSAENYTNPLNNASDVTAAASFEAIYNTTTPVKILLEDVGYFRKVTAQGSLSEFTALLAIYSALIKRYFLGAEVLTASIEDIIGNSFQVYSFYFSIDKNQTLREHFEKTKLNVLDALQSYSDGDLSSNINSLSFGVSDYGFSWNNCKEQEELASMFQLNIGLCDENYISYSLSYKENFVPEYLAEHFSTTFKSWLLNLESHIKKLVNLLPILTTEDAHILNTFNSSDKFFPAHCTIVDLFEEQVRRTPDALAVLFNERLYTYSELNIKVNQAAHYLTNQYQIKAGEIIGVLASKSDETLITILAILKSGGAFLPIDESYPTDRIRYIIDDSRLSLLICDEKNLERVDFDRKLVTNMLQSNTLNSLDPSKKILPTDLAYVIYTSGSTGKPKGVMIEHRSNVNMSLSQIEIFDLSNNDRVVWFASISFDASVSELMMAFYSGATLIIPEIDITNDSEKLGLFLRATNATVITLPPSYLDVLSDEHMSGLKTIITAGESAHINRALHMSETKNYFNAYGPTECAVCVSTYKVDTSSDNEKSAVPIGKPIANMQMHILDNYLNSLPVGAIGKIFVSGVGVGRGYLNRDELTKDKFILKTLQAKGPLYDTGDLGRWDNEGNVWFMGRSDDQVKIRGYRIEPGEIETILLTYPFVKQASVIVNGINSEKQLVAFIVFNEQKPGIGELKELLRTQLPEYMIPGGFVELMGLPMTSNGKVDKRALLSHTKIEVHKSEYISPKNDLESTLIEIWQSILNISGIGIKDNFFEMGGHSLLVIKLVNRIKEKLNKTVSVKEVFKYPTIEKLSSKLINYETDTVEPAGIRESYPLTPTQKGIWIQDNLQRDKCLYNVLTVSELTGDIDIEKLSQAFNILIHRYEILRTIFKLDDSGEIKQFVLPTDGASFTIKKIDICGQSKESFIKKHVEVELTRIFDLDRFPLFASSIAKTEDNKFVLILNLHHLITDGWSMELIKFHWMKIYENIKSNSVLEGFTSPEFQFKDYAVWLNNNINSAYWAEEESYWLGQFKEEATSLDIQQNGGNIKDKSFSGENWDYKFSDFFSDLVTRFSKTSDVTLFATLFAGINSVLSRYSGESDITIGVPFSNRNLLKTENMIGIFLNVLPVRCRFSTNPNFNDILNEVNNNLINAYQNCSLPFEIWSEKLQTTNKRLFNVMAVLQNHSKIFKESPQSFSADQIMIEGKTTSQYDLIFRFSEDDGLSLNVEYNSNLYDRPFIKRMVSHFENLLLQAIYNPKISINKLNYLSEIELQQLEKFNSTHEVYPIDCTVVDLFEQQVKRKPDSIAVIFQDRKITYKEISKSSNQFAHYLLKKLPIEIEDRISINIEKSEWLIVTLLGILKTGAAYVPIDPNYSEERRKYLEQYSECSFSINDAVLNDFFVTKDNFPEICPDVDLKPENLFHVMFTSGSTGQPKGVMLQHKNIVNLITTNNNFNINDDTILLSTVATSFDTTNVEFWGVLVNGGKLVLEHRTRLFDYDYLNTILKRYQVNSLWLTSAWFPQIVEHNIEIFSGLKQFISGGDVVSRKHINILKEKYPDLKVLNGYGPTETTTFSTIFEITKYFDGAIPIGKPIKNTLLYVLNNDFVKQPIGLFGELFIAGDGVARGYLNKPDLTEEKFIDNPFKMGYKMYRTGDLVRWMEDGNIEFKGRKDNQIKISGHRIEVIEIEKLILEFPGIKEAVVVFHNTGETNSGNLIAVLVLKNRIELTALKRYLFSILPDYMVPVSYKEISAIPVNPNGKLDKSKLLNSSCEIGLNSRHLLSARNPWDDKLLNIWQEVLNSESLNISIDDNFFELGGNSLKVTILINKIHKEFGVKLGLKELFTHVTVKDQSDLIIKTHSTNYDNIELSEKQDYYELSPSQLRLWLLNKISENNASFNLYGTYVISEELDLDCLGRSIEKLVERHEVLRTIFTEIKGSPKQKILDLKQLDFKVELLDLSHDDNAEATLRNIQNNVFNHSFKLESWSLFKVVCVKNDTKYKLLYSMHHIICDGWSMEIFVRDLLAIYKAQLNHSQFLLPLLNIQYKDYSNWQNKKLLNNGFLEQEKYWQSHLNGILPRLRLPVDHEPDGSAYNGDISFCDLAINEELHNEIKKYLIEKKVSLFALFTASFKILLYRLTGEKDIIIGTPVSNRNHEDAKNLIGFFLNTLMIRSYLNDESNFDFFLSQVNDSLINGLENQSYPFEKLLEKLNIERDYNNSPISPIFLNMLNFDIKEAKSDNNISRHVETNSFGNFDLECYFQEYTTKILIKCIFKKSLFNKETIEYWINGFVSVIKQVVSDSNIVIKKIKLFSKPQFLVQHVKPINTFNFYNDECVNQSIVSRFEEQVIKYPENIAIRHDGADINYLELNALANGLAGEILLSHIYNENIALLFGHHPMAVIGMLGVLKSGNAYVPLDPYFPADRLIYMVQDANCKIIIANSETIALAQTIAKRLKRVIVINASDNILPIKDNLEVKIAVNNKAYILYTSGSTGQPKGVVQVHKNVLHFIRAYTNNLHINANDNLSLLSAYSFDASVMDIFGALLNGATLLFYDIKLNGVDNLPSWLRENAVSIFHTVPTIYRYFISVLDEQIFENIRLVVLGGEATYKIDFENFKKHFGRNSIFINGFGPTESTVTLQKLLNHDSILTARNIPIGSPVQDTQVYLLNENDEVAEIYQTGEIVYKSEYLSIGYLNQQQKTDAVFTIDPVTKTGRVYRSGDFGRLLPTGEIEFVGRKDDQIKLNGQRIELSEIEQHLLKLYNIAEAIVLLKEINKQHKLVAYIRLKKEEMEIYSIKQYLQTKLPIFMVPNVYIFLGKFPLTPTGKISRLDLPEPTKKEINHDEYLAASNETEKKLVEIWEKTLSRNGIGVKENFFEIGGNSLNAFIVLNKVFTTFSVKIDLKDFFGNATIKELSKLIREAFVNDAAVYKDKIGKAPLLDFYPLSHAQKRLWLQTHYNIRSDHYNYRFELIIEGESSENKIISVIKQLIKKHEALRTSFHLINQQPAQLIAPYNTLILPIEYLNLIDKDDYWHEIAWSTGKDLNIAFDISVAPLFKIKLFKIGKAKFVLSIVIHHLIFDGWSNTILLKDIFNLLNKEEQSNELLGACIQQKDFAFWEVDSAIKNVKGRSFWAKLLKGVDDLALKIPKTTMEKKSMQNSYKHINLENNEISILNDIKEKYGLTSFMIYYITSWLCCYVFSDQNKFIIGAISANRENDEIKNTVGFFVNILPISLSVTATDTFHSFITKAKRIIISSLENQDYPYDLMKISRKVGIEKSSPSVNVMFAFQNNENVSSALSDNKIKIFPTDNNAPFLGNNYDLTIEFDYANNGALKYNQSKFEESGINLFIKIFKEIIVKLKGSEKLNLIGVFNDKRSTISKLFNDNASPESIIETSPDCNPLLLDRLKRIWQKILKKDEIEVNDGFFDCGGSSLKLLILINQINKGFNKHFHVSEIIPHLTLERLAFFIENNQVSSTQNEKTLIRFNEIINNANKNIFFIHDGSGEVDGYAYLCNSLKYRYNCYGIRLNFDSIFPKELNIEETVKVYVDYIKQVQPTGPYYVGAWSLGGIYAFELASQLEAMGEEVRSLLFFDVPYAYSKGRIEKFSVEGELQLLNDIFSVKNFQGEVTSASVESYWKDIEKKLNIDKNFLNDFKKIYNHSFPHFKEMNDASTDELLISLNKFRSIVFAASKYLPKYQLTCKLYFFKPSISKAHPELWRNFFKSPVEIMDVSGDHFSLFLKTKKWDDIFADILN